MGARQCAPCAQLWPTHTLVAGPNTGATCAARATMHSTVNAQSSGIVSTHHRGGQPPATVAVDVPTHRARAHMHWAVAPADHPALALRPAALAAQPRCATPHLHHLGRALGGTAECCGLAGSTEAAAAPWGGVLGQRQLGPPTPSGAAQVAERLRARLGTSAVTRSGTHHAAAPNRAPLPPPSARQSAWHS